MSLGKCIRPWNHYHNQSRTFTSPPKLPPAPLQSVSYLQPEATTHLPPIMIGHICLFLEFDIIPYYMCAFVSGFAPDKVREMYENKYESQATFCPRYTVTNLLTPLISCLMNNPLLLSCPINLLHHLLPPSLSLLCLLRLLSDICLDLSVSTWPTFSGHIHFSRQSLSFPGLALAFEAWKPILKK